MPHAIVDGLSLVDTIGRCILATTVLGLLSAIAANLVARARYASLQRDLEQSEGRFSYGVLRRIVDDALEAARGSGAANTQGIIEERFQSDLKSLLLAERYTKAATGLVIILGLLGTFYGLSLSIGRIVQLVAADAGGATDVAGAVTTGLTHALAGMAVAFTNSLLGIASAVVLTVLNVFSNVTDRRIAVMLRIETHVDRLLSKAGISAASGAVNAATLLEAVARFQEVVARFEAGLARFSASTGEFHEFNAHLKDNIQRMSLSFGDFSDTLKGQVMALRAK